MIIIKYFYINNQFLLCMFSTKENEQPTTNKQKNYNEKVSKKTEEVLFSSVKRRTPENFSWNEVLVSSVCISISNDNATVQKETQKNK